MRYALALFLVLAAAPLPAQRRTPLLELGADFSHWTLGFGSGFNAPPERTGGSLRAGVVMPGRPPISLGVHASHAREDSTAPGVTAVAAEIATRVFRVQPDDPNVFLQLGAGALHVASDQRQAVLDRCVPEVCFYEGPNVIATGWYPTVNAGVGIDIPFARWFMVQPTAALVKVMTDKTQSDHGGFIRLGIGFVVRL